MSARNHSRKPFRRLVTLLTTGITKCLIPSTFASPAPLDGPSEGMMMEGISVYVQEESHEEGRQSQVAIEILLDDLLLEIFDLYREESTRGYPVKAAWEWTTLAHVCRRWRAIIFASPRRLHLRVTCDARAPVKTSLNIWPPFPIAIIYFPFDTVDEKGEDNLVAALEHRDRISDIHIFHSERSSVEKFVVAMQETLPALTNLYLGSFFPMPLVLPDAFLGGYAPRLRSLSLHHVTFPAFTRFVLRATHIVTLRLFVIPPSEAISISPELMTTFLAALSHLGSLSIVFQRAPTSPLQTTPPPLTRGLALSH